MPAMAKGLPRLTIPFWSPASRKRWQRYLRETRRPLHSLLFLAPLVLLYEFRGVLTGSNPGLDPELLAHSVIQDLLGWFGFVGVWLPPLVFLGALGIAHRARRDRLRVRWWCLPGMLVESLVLAIPLLATSALFEPPPQMRPLEALGAGVYEELVFRMLLISGLAWLMSEIVHVPAPPALGLAAVLGALLFALCHFEPIGSELPAWKPFWFKFAAGVYLSVLYIGRGLGVSAGSHAAYNLLLVWLRG